MTSKNLSYKNTRAAQSFQPPVAGGADPFGQSWHVAAAFIYGA